MSKHDKNCFNEKEEEYEPSLIVYLAALVVVVFTTGLAGIILVMLDK